MNKGIIVPIVFALTLAGGCRGPVLDPALPADQEAKITIGGIVTVTRNNAPLNLAGGAVPAIRAYSSPDDREEDAYLGDTGTSAASTVTRLDDGSYRWSMDIPAQKAPLNVYFEVLTWIDGVSGSPKQTTRPVRVAGPETGIDLGHINYETLTLSGRTPVTINGETAEFAGMTISSADQSVYCEAEIRPSGLWSIGIMKPESEKLVRFSIEAHKGGGVFRKAVQTAAAIYDRDMVFSFPDCESVNFEALTLSGTLKALTPEGYQPWGYVEFYPDTVDVTSWDSYYHTLGRSEIRYDKENGGGEARWTVMIPASLRPGKLKVTLDVQMGDDFYWAYSALALTDKTDLRRINLGTFTKWDGYAYGGL